MAENRVDLEHIKQDMGRTFLPEVQQPGQHVVAVCAVQVAKLQERHPTWRSPEVCKELALVRLTELRWHVDEEETLSPDAGAVFDAMGASLDDVYRLWEGHRWDRRLQDLQRAIRSAWAQQRIPWPDPWPPRPPSKDEAFDHVPITVVMNAQRIVGQGRFRFDSTLTTYLMGALLKETEGWLRDQGFSVRGKKLIAKRNPPGPIDSLDAPVASPQDPVPTTTLGQTIVDPSVQHAQREAVIQRWIETFAAQVENAEAVRTILGAWWQAMGESRQEAGAVAEHRVIHSLAKDRGLPKVEVARIITTFRPVLARLAQRHGWLDKPMEVE